MPEFLTKGITYLIPKRSHSTDPAKYRPIACLSTMYKIITACLANKLYAHCDEHKIMAEEQKGSQKGSLGCKEQLLIDMVVTKQACRYKRNLHMTYIDHAKAYDSVPHSWLISILKIYKVNKEVVSFLANMMSRWKTTLILSSKETRITIPDVRIRKGIYQGDSLSPLWFCLALDPLSNKLNREGSG